MNNLEFYLEDYFCNVDYGMIKCPISGEVEAFEDCAKLLCCRNCISNSVYAKMVGGQCPQLSVVWITDDNIIYYC